MIKPILLSLSLLSLLQGCGGDGDSSGEAGPGGLGLTAPAAAEPTAAAIGSVTARFVPGKNSRYLLLSKFMQSVGRADDAEQADSGAIVRLGSNSLFGAQQTVDVAGDAHFALGRWLKGTLTQTSEPPKTSTLTGTDQDSYHYLAYNRLAELPTSGQIQCTTVAATAPTALTDAAVKTGSASGTASVSFDASGAAIKGTLQVRAGADNATVDLSTQIEEAASMSITGLLFGNGRGAGMVLADQGNNVPALVVAYRADFPGGALYNGVARFTCTNK